MGDKLSLDSFLRKYREGRLDKKELEGIIFDYILKNRTRFKLRRWPEDEYIDFLCWFYPRIGRAIDNYRDHGSSFDAYIAATVRWASREYIRVEVSHRITEQTYWDARTQEMDVCEQEPAYGDSPVPFKPVTNPRQTLMLLLKSYYFISEDFIDRAAPAIGMKKERLKQLIEQLRILRIPRDNAINDTRNRIHTLYYRSISLERRINAALEGSARYEKLKIRLEQTRRQLASMRNRFKRMRTNPTNQQVAQVLGIPKGTIDSSLFAIKKKSACSETTDKTVSADGGCE
ncbi:MAG: hypothetical protein LBH70_09505 [Spirochaetaceae bacterium]|jgi:hypothetical protein|nr:hypothetical protein [Spirochaetaceae bacterium]